MNIQKQNKKLILSIPFILAGIISIITGIYFNYINNTFIIDIISNSVNINGENLKYFKNSLNEFLTNGYLTAIDTKIIYALLITGGLFLYIGFFNVINRKSDLSFFEFLKPSYYKNTQTQFSYTKSKKIIETEKNKKKVDLKKRIKRVLP